MPSTGRDVLRNMLLLLLPGPEVPSAYTSLVKANRYFPESLGQILPGSLVKSMVPLTRCLKPHVG